MMKKHSMLIVACITASVLLLEGCSFFMVKPATKPSDDKTTVDTPKNTDSTNTSGTATQSKADTTTPMTTTPKTTTPKTTTPKTTTPATTAPATTTPPDTAPAETGSPGIDFNYIMSLDNTRHEWSYEYPDDLSSYNGIYKADPKYIYLTFDLGYEGGYTSKILDTLKAKGAHATFFLTAGYIEENRNLVKRMIDEGHRIGCHAFNHANMIKLTQTTPGDMIDDFNKWNDVFGGRTNLYRAPEGAFSQRGMTLLTDLGYTAVFWGAAYADWDTSNQMPEDQALAKIKSVTDPGDVVLLHPFKTNSLILGRYIDWIRSRGWKTGQL